MKKPKAKPCRECGGKDIEIGDCGYSSFNVGWGKCKKCGFEVKVSPCGCFPHDEIVERWNKRNTIGAKVADRLRKLADVLEGKDTSAE